MVAIDRSHLLDLLQRMIRANSVIPREEPLAALLADEVKKLGLEPVWHEVAPGRPNVYASAVLGPRDRFVTFTGHLDTVGPALGWETDPFEPAMTDARLSGLGAIDMKSGLACGFAAFKALLEARELHPECGRIGFAGTVDEEGYSIGARALLTTEYARSSLLLLGEPYFGDTEANPVPCAMPGKVLYRVTTRGKAAHGFHPEDGINAVEDAARIVAALDRLPPGKHPLIRSGNYSTLKFEGGYQEYAIVVPEVCEVIVTRLLVPGETRDLAVEQLRSLVESLGLRSRVTIETPPPSYQPLVIDQDLPALGHFRRAYREVLGREPVVGGRQGIVDGSIYMNEGGIPTIAFGPRGGGLHMAGEWVETATLEPVAMVMAETALREMAS